MCTSIPKRSLFSLMVLLTLLSVTAAGSDDERVLMAGKIYTADGSTVIKGAVLRIVQMETGESLTATSDKEGCYRLKHKPGHCRVSVEYEGSQYFLAEHLDHSKPRQPKSMFSNCFILEKGGSVTPREQCAVCKAPGFPPKDYVIIGIGAAGSGLGVRELTKKEKEASPSQ